MQQGVNPDTTDNKESIRIRDLAYKKPLAFTQVITLYIYYYIFTIYNGDPMPSDLLGVGFPMHNHFELYNT